MNISQRRQKFARKWFKSSQSGEKWIWRDYEYTVTINGKTTTRRISSMLTREIQITSRVLRLPREETLEATKIAFIIALQLQGTMSGFDTNRKCYTYTFKREI
ncbi:hypothetical protein PMAYCL1PPCAC_28583, partial [Pristionchus mayeri]